MQLSTEMLDAPIVTVQAIASKITSFMRSRRGAQSCYALNLYSGSPFNAAGGGVWATAFLKVTNQYS